MYGYYREKLHVNHRVKGFKLLLMRLTALALVNFSSHFLISSGETLLLDKSIYPVKLLDIS